MILNPRSCPVGCSHSTSTRSTCAGRGPLWHQLIMCLTAVAEPSNTASTRPSSRLRTQPSTPVLRACSRAAARKLTPCTRPSILTCARSRSITILFFFTSHTQSSIEPSAERYFIFLLLFVFSLVERKNEQQKIV